MKPFSVIGPCYQHLIKPVLFRFDPEFVHDRFTSLGHFLGKTKLTRSLVSLLLNYSSPALTQTVAGMEFTNPIGLAAGFDKNAMLLNILPQVGFGFEEVGSITLGSYAGNPKPRLFRLPKSQGLIVNYGLKNDGVEAITPRIRNSHSYPARIGISIAKTNDISTSTEKGGIEDYYNCLQKVEAAHTGDYYTINISCPNTFGGEPFTTATKLDKLLHKLNQVRTRRPMFVKLPINLSLVDFDSLLQVCVRHKVTGVVIGNLTKVRSKDLIKDTIPEPMKGGVSGKPTWQLSNDLISYTYQHYGDKLIIIGVGGIFSAEDAYEKIKRGATLLQLITGMIFEGPQLIGEINYGLTKLLEQDGYTNIHQAIGAYHT